MSRLPTADTPPSLQARVWLCTVQPLGHTLERLMRHGGRVRCRYVRGRSAAVTALRHPWVDHDGIHPRHQRTGGEHTDTQGYRDIATVHAQREHTQHERTHVPIQRSCAIAPRTRATASVNMMHAQSPIDATVAGVGGRLQSGSAGHSAAQRHSPATHVRRVHVMCGARK